MPRRPRSQSPHPRLLPQPAQIRPLENGAAAAAVASAVDRACWTSWLWASDLITRVVWIGRAVSYLPLLALKRKRRARSDAPHLVGRWLFAKPAPFNLDCGEHSHAISRKFSRGRRMIQGQPQGKLSEGFMVWLMRTEPLQQSLVFFQEFRLVGGRCQRTGELGGSNRFVEAGILGIRRGQSSNTVVCLKSRHFARPRRQTNGIFAVAKLWVGIGCKTQGQIVDKDEMIGVKLHGFKKIDQSRRDPTAPSQENC